MNGMPAELRKVIAANKKAKAQWESLTPIAQRDFISWIQSAKQPETRLRRIESVPSRLASGKRRPCCYALVPMDLYRALGKNAKAKATWSALAPGERRDFNDWINAAKDPKAQEDRIRKACAALASGKRRP